MRTVMSRGFHSGRWHVTTAVVQVKPLLRPLVAALRRTICSSRTALTRSNGTASGGDSISYRPVIIRNPQAITWVLRSIGACDRTRREDGDGHEIHENKHSKECASNFFRRIAGTTCLVHR